MAKSYQIVKSVHNVEYRTINFVCIYSTIIVKKTKSSGSGREILYGKYLLKLLILFSLGHGTYLEKKEIKYYCISTKHVRIIPVRIKNCHTV